MLSSLLCFGAGVLLSTSLVHILPEVRRTAPRNYQQYSEMVFCAGFFVLYLLDELVHFFYGESHETGTPHSPKDVRRHPANGRGRYGATERDSLVANPPPYNPTFAEEGVSQLCHVSHQEPCRGANASNFGLLVALSVHATLEGLVVGLEDSSGKVKRGVRV